MHHDTTEAAWKTGAVPATFDELGAAATRHLGGERAEQWVSLLRPAAALVHHRSPVGAVGCLGGRPPLPADFAWPVWEGRGPLAHIATVDLGAVARTVPRVAVPDQVVSAFYWDGALDGGVDIVISEDPESAAGAALLTVPDPAALTGDPVPLPPELTAYPRIWLAARGVWTWPSLDHPAMRPLRESASDFYDQLSEIGGGWHRPAHQVGGHTDNVQGPPAIEAARWDGTAWGDIDKAAAAERWSLVLQIDTDQAAKMQWGDVGVLYWLAELPPDRSSLGEVRFVWQCH